MLTENELKINLKYNDQVVKWAMFFQTDPVGGLKTSA
jgi:hypothetical protein